MKGKFKLLEGPLDTAPGKQGGLGGEAVHQEGAKSVPDPLSLNKVKGSKTKKKGY